MLESGQPNGVLILRRAGRHGTPESFAVRFVSVPRVGEKLSIDHESVRRLKDESLHKSDWTIVDVTYEVSLPPNLAPEDTPKEVKTAEVNPRVVAE